MHFYQNVTESPNYVTVHSINPQQLMRCKKSNSKREERIFVDAESTEPVTVHTYRIKKKEMNKNNNPAIFSRNKLQ